MHTLGLPASLTSASSSSVQSVREAIASYRRAQYIYAESTAPSTSDSPGIFDDDDDDDIEEGIVEIDENEDALVTPRPDDFVGPFDWEDFLPRTAEQQSGPMPSLPLTRKFSVRKEPPIHERTPLLRKAVSFSLPPLPPREACEPDSQKTLHVPHLQRRPSVTSIKSIRHYGGQSTFGQTLFNSIAILLGIGMLSEPLAFAYAGWGAGTVLIIFYGFLSCYTAKILAGIILSDPHLRSYSDVGRKAFGPRATLLISIMFCLELFAVSVILVTLYADSMHAIFPQYSPDTYKLWGILLLIPTVFLPLSLLSYTSILGIISSLVLVVVLFVDGFSKKTSPGSLWSPADTYFGVDDWGNLGIAFGLFMAGFSGHAVIPSLARDMIDPSEFDKMINWAFIVATSVYTVIGYAGYLMFGRAVSDEISEDLLKTPGYNSIINEAALWMLVVSPLSKFALTTQPLNATIESLLYIERQVDSTIPTKKGLTPRRLLSMFQRVAVTLLSVGVSILIPEFSSMMAFLGSFSAFLLCIIGPITAKVAIAGKCGVFDGLIVVIAIVMAVWGTVAAFLSP